MILVKKIQMYEHSPLDAAIEVKKGGFIKVNLNHVLNTVLPVAPLLSSKWHLVST